MESVLYVKEQEPAISVMGQEPGARFGDLFGGNASSAMEKEFAATAKEQGDATAVKKVTCQGGLVQAENSACPPRGLNKTTRHNH